MDWFLYDNGLRHERVKLHLKNPHVITHPSRHLQTCLNVTIEALEQGV